MSNIAYACILFWIVKIVDASFKICRAISIAQILQIIFFVGSIMAEYFHEASYSILRQIIYDKILFRVSI